MSQINGNQIKNGAITTTQLSATAGITDAQLATLYIKADGSRSFTGEVGGVSPTVSTSLATKGYVDTLALGLTPKGAVDVATVGTETYTIVSGSVTQITGSSIDGQTVLAGWRILIKDAPSASGVGSVNSAQPSNGIYTATAVGANITVARTSDMSGTDNAAGAWTLVQSGTVNGKANFGVISPSVGTSTTYGTTNIQWTQTNGLADVTVGSGGSLVESGNQLTRAALTGDVTAAADSNTTTVAAAAITFSKMANLAANSVIGNSTGSAATPTALTLASAATPSSVVQRDTNGNVTFNSVIEAVASTATAAGTTTLTVASAQTQQFTGTNTQTVVLPNATTLQVGQQFTVANRSTGAVTVNSTGGSLVQTMAASSQATYTLITNGTAAGTWDVAYSITNAGSGGGTVTSASVVTANGFGGTVANPTTTPAITITTSVNGLIKGNGTALAAAVAGTDYLGPANYIVRETPGGTVNGSTTAFTLANTPTSGSEMVFRNGILQIAGGVDYTISANTITFTTAPNSGDTLSVTYLH
jgi:hypothetical protein